MRRLTLIPILLALLVQAAAAGPQGMVTRVTPEGEVVFNCGVSDEVKPGARWTVSRMGRPMAEVEVLLVDSYSSRARLVRGTDVRVGDRVFEGLLPVGVEPPAPSPSMDPHAVASADTTAAPAEVTPSDARSAQGRYDDLRAANTRSRSFSGGAQAKNEISIDPWSALNLFTGFGYGGQNVGSWQVITSTVAEQVGTNVTNANLYQNNRLEVQVTHWDETLLNSYADSLAMQENRTSIDERLALRASLYAQKGLDRFVVFQVKLINHGPGTVQVAPLHWHMYLVDSQGNRVKAERYDQVLDRTLNPDQSVEGSVYFLKLDVSGRPVVDPRNVNVVLEDILGERADMSFASGGAARTRTSTRTRSR